MWLKSWALGSRREICLKNMWKSLLIGIERKISPHIFLAPETTEALLVTYRRSFQYPRNALGEHQIEWKKSIKYLGVQLDRRLSFGEHQQIATSKAIQCGAALTRLIPNIGGQPCYPEEAVLGTEKCGDENCLSIPNCVDECCAGPGERPANWHIGRGKEVDLSAP